ncbi:MAG: carbohydrate kinase [Alistipes sp.]|nr:carbohydrate kinase [Alistipes sp.]
MSNTQQNYIVGIGEALWDMLPEGRKIGGAPANFTFHVSQFGLDAVAVSAVGDDALGKEIHQTFEQKGLQTQLATVPYPTGTVEVTLDEKGIPQYDICEGVAWDNIPFTAELEALARNTIAVCFGTLAQRNSVSRQTIEKFITTMPAEGIKICDINLRGTFYSKEVVESSMRACDILKINDEEIVEVCRLIGIEMPTQRMMALRLMERYEIDMLILTCGTEGSYIYCMDGTESFLPTPKVKVADTVGAGDSFTGAFIAALLCGKEVKKAHALAVEVSAYVCTQNGAMPELPEKIIDKL